MSLRSVASFMLLLLRMMMMILMMMLCVGKSRATFASPGVSGQQITAFQVTNDDSVAYIINGQRNPTLQLVRGQTYTFAINAVGHPFWIKTAQVR